MNEQEILDDVFELARVIFASEIVASADDMRETLITAEEVLADFFMVLENLKMVSSKLDVSKLDFEHHVMWYSAYCEMRRKESFDRNELSEKAILEKFGSNMKNADKG